MSHIDRWFRRAGPGRAPDTGERDCLFGVAIVAAPVLIGAALSLALLRPLLLDDVVIPFAATTISPDGVIEAETRQRVEDLMRALVPMLLALGAMVLVWAIAWRYLAQRLIERPAGEAFRGDAGLRVGKLEIGLVVLLTLVAAVVRAPLMVRGLSYDELWTAVAFVDVETLWRTISYTESFNNHIGYSVAARVSQIVLGHSEVALRIPSFIYGVAAIPVLWLFARRFFGVRLAVVAVVGLVLSSAHIAASATARGYAGMLLFCLLSSYAFLGLLRQPTRRLLVLYIATSVLAVYTHLFSTFVIAAQTLVLLHAGVRPYSASGGLEIPTRASFRSLLGAIAAIAALSIAVHAPALPGLLTTFSRGEPSRVDLWLPFNVLRDLSVNWSWPAVLLLTALAAVGFAVSRRDDPVMARYVALLFALPVVSVWLLRPEFVRTRFFSYLLPFYILLVAAGLFWLWRRPLQRGRRWSVGTAAVLVATALAAFFWSRRPYSHVPLGGWRDAVAVMEDGAGPETGLCAAGIGNRFFSYYSDRVFVPQTVAEFDDFVSKHTAVRCAYNPSEFNTPAHREIGRRLGERSSPERFHTLLLYRIGP